jgi:hypothetical protein
MQPRTTTVVKLAHDRHGGQPRVVRISLPFVDFGDGTNEKGADLEEPAPAVSRLRRWGPRHRFERD